MFPLDARAHLVNDYVYAFYAFKVTECFRKFNNAGIMRLQDVEDKSSYHLRTTKYIP